MQTIPSRLFVYTKDVTNITGKHPRSSRRLLNAVRSKLGKPQGAPVTLEEFCIHVGLKLDDVRPFVA